MIVLQLFGSWTPWSRLCVVLSKTEYLYLRNYYNRVFINQFGVNRCYKRASQRVSLIAWRISCPVGDKETRENVNEGKIKSAPDGCSLRGKRRKETKRKEKKKEKEKKKKKKKEKGENISIVLRQIQCFESATAG